MRKDRRQGPSPAIVAGSLAGMALPALALAAATLPGAMGVSVPWFPHTEASVDALPPPKRLAATPKPAHPDAKPKLPQRAGPIPTGRDASPPDLDAPPPAPAGVTVAGGGGWAGAFGLASASLAIPFGATGWAQFDGLAGAGSRGPFGGVAFQALAGDPRLVALGIYAGGSAHQFSDVMRLGATAFATRGAFSAIATLGIEDVGGRSAFFDMVDLVYRPFPSLSLSVGHRHMDGRDLAATGVSADVGDGFSVVGEGRFGPGLPGRTAEVSGLLGLRFGLGGAPSAAVLPSRLVDDALVPPARRAR